GEGRVFEIAGEVDEEHHAAFLARLAEGVGRVLEEDNARAQLGAVDEARIGGGLGRWGGGRGGGERRRLGPPRTRNGLCGLRGESRLRLVWRRRGGRFGRRGRVGRRRGIAGGHCGRGLYLDDSRRRAG